MEANQVLVFAAIAQVALTFFVAFILFARRVAELKQRKIHPQTSSICLKCPCCFIFFVHVCLQPTHQLSTCPDLLGCLLA